MKDRTAKGRPFAGGFTLTELLVVIALVALLVAVVSPVFTVARRAGRDAACLSNLHHQGVALLQYMDDYQDFPFITFVWSCPGPCDDDAYEAAQRANPNAYPNAFAAYLKNPDVFRCPNDIGGTFVQDQVKGRERGLNDFERWGTSYRPDGELFWFGIAPSAVKDPTKIFWAADSEGQWGTAYWLPADWSVVDNTGYDNHMPRWVNNAVFLDGHAKPARFLPEIWNPFQELLFGPGKLR